MKKLTFPHVAMGNNPTGQPNLPSLLPTGPDFLRSFRSGKGTAEWIHSDFPELIQFLSPGGQ
jgi:hypothetical protein